jgi:peptidoglycan/xylan/chitin deacetylase (PgdA/CDA1 family)
MSIAGAGCRGSSTTIPAVSADAALGASCGGASNGMTARSDKPGTQGGFRTTGLLRNPARKLARRLLYGLQSALAVSGIADLYVRLKCVRGAVVLVYHSIADDPEASWIDPANHLSPARFERQMKFLARSRRVVSMTDLVEAIEKGRDLDPGSVVITLDDGYRDNLNLAAPILGRYNLPATLFLPSSYVRRRENQWIDRLYGLFRARTRHLLTLAAREGGVFDLRQPRQECQAYEEASELLLSATLAERDSWFAELEGQLQPSARAPQLTLGWDDVREILRRYPRIEVGAHTCDHIDLNTRPLEVAQAELDGCVEEIKRETGVRPIHFAYPYERWTPQTKREIERRGFRSAVGSGTEFLIGSAADQFALPRINASLSFGRFQFVTSGAYPRLTQLLVGRA